MLMVPSFIPTQAEIDALRADAFVAVGDRWHVKMPMAITLMTVTVTEVTPKTLLVRHGEPGTYEQRYLRSELQLVEKVAP